MKRIISEALCAERSDFYAELMRKSPKVFRASVEAGQRGVIVLPYGSKRVTSMGYGEQDPCAVYRESAPVKFEKKWGALQCFKIVPHVNQATQATAKDIISRLAKMKLSKRLATDRDLFDNQQMLPQDCFYVAVDKFNGAIYLMLHSQTSHS